MGYYENLIILQQENRGWFYSDAYMVNSFTSHRHHFS